MKFKRTPTQKHETELILSLNEFLILRSGLGEMIMGIGVADSEKELGASKEEALQLWKTLDQQFKRSKKEEGYINAGDFDSVQNTKVSLTLELKDLKIIRNGLNGTLNELNYGGEFQTRLGVSRELGIQALNEIDSFFNDLGI